jgi:hypothetical protein
MLNQGTSESRFTAAIMLERAFLGWNIRSSEEQFCEMSHLLGEEKKKEEASWTVAEKKGKNKCMGPAHRFEKVEPRRE